MTPVDSLSSVFLRPLGLAALAAAVPVVVLYLLKPDPDRFAFPAVEFLLGDREESRSRSALRRLRRNVLLVVQLAAVVALAVSLAAPYVAVSESRAVSETVVVVDATASMATEAERKIVDRYTRDVDATVSVEQRVSTGELRQLQRLTHQVPIADDVRDLAVELVRETRTADDLEYGASPRASMSLVRAAKARALIERRTHVSAEDVTAVAPPVLRHRVVVDFRAEREGTTPDDVIAALVDDR